MTDTPRDIAMKLLPGWTVVRCETVGSTHTDADAQTPSIDAVRRAYNLGGAGRMDGLAAASNVVGEAEFVVMAPPVEAAPIGQKVVVISNGRPIAIQG